ncbi:hypothetical protein FXO37_24750 [Capsicum annuum]|nr:hypothetical protein FXO37_24750 [Capsicum annuum]
MNLTKIIKEESATKPIGDDTLVDRVEKIARLYMLVWCLERMLPLQPGLYETEDDDTALIETLSHTLLSLLKINRSHDGDAGSYFADWMDRYGKLVVPVHGAVLRDYALWFLKHRWLLIGNPAIKKYYTVGFVPSAGSVAALEYSKADIEEACDAISLDGQFCDTESLYYNVNAQGRVEGRDGRPRRDVEAIRLSYGSAIGDGYMADIPIRPPGTQNVGQTFTQHTAFINKTNSLFGNTNEMFDVSMSGRNLKSLLGYDRPTSSGFHLDSMSFPASTCQAGETGQGDILPTWVRPPNDTQIDGSSSVVSSSDEDEFIIIDAHMAHPPGPKVPVMRAKKKWEEILPTKTKKDGDGFRPLDTLHWCEQIKFHLGVLDLDVALYSEKPTAIIEANSDEEKPYYKNWDCYNRLGLMFMQMNIAGNIKTTLPKTESAKELLKLMEVSSQVADKSFAGTLIGTLTTMKFDGSRTMHEHIIEMTNIAARLKLLGMEVEQNFLVQFIINLLPSEYGPFQMNYNTMKDK